MSRHEIRDRLAENSRIFLKRSTEELENSPRHAIVDLGIGLELLMKARLAHEHWSLVAEKPGGASLEEFKNGGVKSVGFVDAIKRINKVAGAPFSADDCKLLNSISEHRNKVVHFYHDKLDGTDTQLQEEVAIEQCTAWLLVKRLTEGEWGDLLELHRASWLILNASFNGSRIYLKKKFDSLASVIAPLAARGVLRDCEGCGFRAMKPESLAHCLQRADCLVCSNTIETFVHVACADCGFVYSVDPEISPYCDNCDKHLWDVMKLEEEPTAWCGCCYMYEPTVHASTSREEPEALCALCLETEEPEECSNCGVLWIAQQRSWPDFGCPQCWGEHD